MKTISMTLLLLALILYASAAFVQAGELVSVDADGLALQGYDPVAYFTDGAPVKGDPEFTARYKEATYRFASAEHRDLFMKNPAKYEPQFGGYCGYAASIDKISPISPDFWQILDGRLVLQHNQKAWDLWNKDVAGNLKKADANWPHLKETKRSWAARLFNS